MKIVLASSSPRRFELLSCLGHEIRVIKPDLDELMTGLMPEKLALANAEKKAHYVYDHFGIFDASLIIAADTIVIFNQKIFGKPKNQEEAKTMLTTLSGHSHQVTTAFCLIGPKGQKHSQAVTSEVSMRKLSEEEIEAYVKSGEPFDKAGGYGVQGAGAAIIKSVSGSLTNVIGLPIEEIFSIVNNVLK
jgi:septum formation protein